MWKRILKFDDKIFFFHINELVFTINNIIKVSFTDERTVAVGGAIRNETGHWKGPWLSFFWCILLRLKLKHFLFFYYRQAVATGVQQILSFKEFILNFLVKFAFIYLKYYFLNYSQFIIKLYVVFVRIS